MKRDWNLIRQILLKLEEKPDTAGTIHPNQFTGYDEETVSEHMRLLSEAGLIEATAVSHHRHITTFCMARSLTWSGHEFLDTVRHDSAWYGMARMAKEKGIELTLDSIKQLASYALATLLK